MRMTVNLYFSDLRRKRDKYELGGKFIFSKLTEKVCDKVEQGGKFIFRRPLSLKTLPSGT